MQVGNDMVPFVSTKENLQENVDILNENRMQHWKNKNNDNMRRKHE